MPTPSPGARRRLHVRRCNGDSHARGGLHLAHKLAAKLVFYVLKRTTYWETGNCGWAAGRAGVARRSNPQSPDPEDAHCLWLIAYLDTLIRQACELNNSRCYALLAQPTNLRQGRGKGRSNAGPKRSVTCHLPLAVAESTTYETIPSTS